MSADPPPGMSLIAKSDAAKEKTSGFRPEIFSSAAPRRAVPVMSCQLPATGLSTSGG